MYQRKEKRITQWFSANVNILSYIKLFYRFCYLLFLLQELFPFICDFVIVSVTQYSLFSLHQWKISECFMYMLTYTVRVLYLQYILFIFPYIYNIFYLSFLTLSQLPAKYIYLCISLYVCMPWIFVFVLCTCLYVVTQYTYYDI